MKGVFRKPTFGELPVVIAVSEELDVFCQGLQSARETTGLASQALEVMAQICVHGFDRIGLLFVGSHFVGSTIIEVVIGWKGI